MNKNLIDIVIPYVNPADKEWLNSFNYWSKKERGITASNRFRDLGSIKYVLRSIEENCKWVNKIFLVLANEGQIPNWLNTDNEKLRIVYHSEYIPANLLPTFNSNTILMHLHRIEDLSDNFILANDDTFFMSKMDEGFFFKDDIPNCELGIECEGLRRTNGNYFLEELNNNATLISKVIGRKVSLKHFHMPLPCSKLFWKFCWNEFNKDLADTFSKFRSNKNYTDWFFNDLGLLTGKVRNVPGLYSKCRFICCTDYPNFALFNGTQMACFNDDMSAARYDQVKKDFNRYMTQKFPKISGFEKF